MSFYQPLDPLRDEVRMLAIVDPPEGSDPSLVHCVLEHVSMDDYAATYQDFLAADKPKQKKQPHWLRYCQTRHLGSPDSSIYLPYWRQQMKHLDSPDAFTEWKEVLTSLDIDISRCPQLLPMRSSTEKSTNRTTQPSLRRTMLSLVPRFQWGDFEAISYCWESEVREKQIVLNQEIFDVPKNLEALLQRLRNLPETKSGMKFWVDALCIDQNNTREKNRQVKLMRKIYSEAFAVIIWLGARTDDSDTAIDFITGITNFTAEIGFGWVGKFESDFEFSELDSETLRQHLLNLPWAALLSFLCRGYWRRLWIIQEMALNRHMSLFLCGGKQLSRVMILRACLYCMQNSNAIDPLITQHLDATHTSIAPMNKSIWPTVSHVKSLISIPGRLMEEQPLGAILDLSRKARVKDPRDKIYGLLGILPHPISSSIIPDYELTQHRVYTQFAEVMTQQRNRLDALFSWCFFTHDSNLPSWLPDWMTPFDRNHVQWLLKQTAGGEGPSEWSITDNGNRLQCTGFIADCIDCASLSPAQNTAYESELSFSNEVGHNYSPHRYGDEQSLNAALARTLLQAHPGRGHVNILDIPWTTQDHRSSENGDDHQSDMSNITLLTEHPAWNFFDQFRQMNAHFPIFGKPLWKFFPQSQSRNLPFKLAHNMKLSTLALMGRNLVTSKSGWLGMAPKAAQVGDLIAIVYGCSFPAVLRPNEDCYWLIGECYVDGIMDGELIAAKHRGEYEEVRFKLC
ncbi:heterokaryon incompatibility protein-domain-containing protein [Bisporella sp. PMI_857]|nr:heterokaryon incompatibility protein-domain-containing protein [Bisporella sp. PMI_857]